MFFLSFNHCVYPLRAQREESLRCRDVDGVAAVQVTQVELDYGGENNHIRIEKANDVFKTLATAPADAQSEPVYRKAVFSLRLEGEKRPRTVSVRAGNTAAYRRGEEAAVIENWMRARGFILIGSGAYENVA